MRNKIKKKMSCHVCVVVILVVVGNASSKMDSVVKGYGEKQHEATGFVEYIKT